MTPRANQLIRLLAPSCYARLQKCSRSTKLALADDNVLVNVGFSGGEKKQGEIVQLVAFAPHFAFLDEIDSGVDVDALEKVFAGIEMLRKEGTAFVVVIHHGAILERMKPDFVHVMKWGRIVRSGGYEIAREVLSKGFENI